MESEVQQFLSRAKSFATQFQQRKDIQDIDDAIYSDVEALDLCQPGHAERPFVLIHLAAHLFDRHSQTRSDQDLDQAIVFGRESLSLLSLGHDLRSTSLINLANHLSVRYNQRRSMQDLEEAIVRAREALTLCPPGHSLRSSTLNSLANHLSVRYNQLGSMRDLDEAIALAREALDLRPPGHSLRSGSLNNLATFLSNRYDKLESTQDMDEAIVFAREALDLRPPGHSIRSSSLNNLANRLSDRFKKHGSMQDLDETISLAREALDLCPPPHALQSSSLNNLASRLSDRFKRRGSMQDLEEAIILAREALRLCSLRHSQRSSFLNNLANRLSDRYRQCGSVQDLEEAIVLAREALTLSPSGHSQRPTSLINLANHFSVRHNQLGSMRDLDEAIVLAREALDLCPPGHSLRSSSLNNLATFLSDRYHQLGSMQDLDEAIVLAREALALRPQGHTGRSQSLANVAIYLYQRFMRTGLLGDEEELFSLYGQLVHVDQFVSSSHLSAATAWTHMAERFQHPTLLLAYDTSLQLLIRHLATLPPLPQHLGSFKRVSSLAVDAFSACLRNRAPARAVELLEQGRNAFWSQLTRLRSPLNGVRASGPEGEKLADEFTRLSSLIRNVLISPGIGQDEQVYRLNSEMQTVVTNIRELPGLSRFLLPSLFSHLRHAASAGPVIIVNASEYGCDALIVLHDRDPVHIPLRIARGYVQGLSMEFRTLTQPERVDDATGELKIFLRKIWDQIVSRVVVVLQMIVSFRSRIWWCPTAEFSSLPLHAAGPFRRGQENMPDLYISSYTPTLTTLIHARRRDPSISPNEEKRFIAIGQSKAPGQIELPSVVAELDMIDQRIEGIAAFTRIDERDSCISRVIEELDGNEWVHFACHSLPNPRQPFESALILHDGLLKVQQIIQCDLKNPEFAYLSAGHTTVGGEESPDEAIHLASAMQFVGFRSVIGTMSTLNDGEAKRITSAFYDHVADESGRLDYTRAAYALNKAMRSANNPLLGWITYIHFGT